MFCSRQTASESFDTVINSISFSTLCIFGHRKNLQFYHITGLHPFQNEQILSAIHNMTYICKASGTLVLFFLQHSSLKFSMFALCLIYIVSNIVLYWKNTLCHLKAIVHSSTNIDSKKWDVFFYKMIIWSWSSRAGLS